MVVRRPSRTDQKDSRRRRQVTKNDEQRGKTNKETGLVDEVVDQEKTQKRVEGRQRKKEDFSQAKRVYDRPRDDKVVVFVKPRRKRSRRR